MIINNIFLFFLLKNANNVGNNFIIIQSQSNYHIRFIEKIFKFKSFKNNM